MWSVRVSGWNADDIILLQEVNFTPDRHLYLAFNANQNGIAGVSLANALRNRKHGQSGVVIKSG